MRAAAGQVGKELGSQSRKEPGSIRCAMGSSSPPPGPTERQPWVSSGGGRLGHRLAPELGQGSGEGSGEGSGSGGASCWPQGGASLAFTMATIMGSLLAIQVLVQSGGAREATVSTHFGSQGPAGEWAPVTTLSTCPRELPQPRRAQPAGDRPSVSPWASLAVAQMWRGRGGPSRHRVCSLPPCVGAGSECGRCGLHGRSCYRQCLLLSLDLKMSAFFLSRTEMAGS